MAAAEPTSRGGGMALVAVLGCLLAAERPARAETTAAEIDALVAQLGDPDYAVRETASQRLAGLGARAADALLTAAEVSDNLEVSLRARWLAESLPITAAGDAAEAVTLLERYGTLAFDERVQVMHRLLRLDDDAGIEPLARIVRLERTAAGSRIAAALLVREWQPDDPYWPGIATRAAAGLGGSRRPAARFLRAVIDASQARSPAASTAALDAAVAAATSLAGRDGGDEPVGLPRGERLGIARTGRIFRRCLAELLARGGRREAALAEARTLFASGDDEAEPDRQLADDLQWLAAHGLPEAVDLVADRLADSAVSPVLTYAAAGAWQARPEADAAERATTLAATAGRQLGELDSLAERLQTAILLAHWGEEDWAFEAYRAVGDDPDATLAQRALVATLGAEFLHDRQRDADAAAMLRGVLEPPTDELAQALMRLDRDPRAVRSRMLFFEALTAAEPQERRRLLEESVRHYSKDVDTLIALYQLPDNTPAQRAEAAARVARAAEGIEEEIQALPDDANAKNEYAWLVANTEGDIAKATRYSRLSLESSFDSASYLDTLAHCQAATGDLDRAVRTQWLAVRQEPHSLLVRRNYERFLTRRQEASARRQEASSP
jgi:hypothetical protein